MTPPLFKGKGRRGSVIVEMVLGFLPYFALMFGIVDFSFVMFVYSTFQNAAREGVRYAITYNTSFGGTAYSSQTLAVQAAVQANALGFLNGSKSSYIVVNYYLPNNLSTPATQASLPQTMPNGTVVNYVNQMGNVVEVKIANYPWSWMVPLPNFMPGGLSLTVSALDVLQGLPVGVFTPPSP